MRAIGIDYPISKADSQFFRQTFDTISNVKSKIYILLKTNPGERVFNNNFGLGLRKYLFEPIDESDYLIESIKELILNKINKYVPEVNIYKLNINIDKDFYADRNTIFIDIGFSLKNDNSQKDEFSIKIE